MTADLLLALALAVWFGLWLLRDQGRLGACRSSTRRLLARHLAARRAEPQRGAGPGALRS
jgi:hypothetical protein